MDQPVFQRNEAGEIVELRPVKVDRQQLQDEHNLATLAAENYNQAVSQLEHDRDELKSKLDEVEKALVAAYTNQEAANEKVAFHGARLAAFDSAVPADSVADDGAEGEADEAVAEPVAGQPTPEEVAETLDLDESAEETVIPVRRRATV